MKLVKLVFIIYSIDHQVLLDKPDAIPALKESEIKDDDQHNIEDVVNKGGNDDGAQQ